MLIALAGLALLLAFYLWRWRRHGVDPSPGVIFPRYFPPEGHSPAGVRYLRRMAYDDRCFAADLVDMGVRGFLAIERDVAGGKEAWRLLRRSGGDLERLDPAQRELARRLFGAEESIELKNSHADRIATARGKHGQALHKRYQPALFCSNAGTVALAVAVWLVSGGSGGGGGGGGGGGR